MTSTETMGPGWDMPWPESAQKIYQPPPPPPEPKINIMDHYLQPLPPSSAMKNFHEYQQQQQQQQQQLPPQYQQQQQQQQPPVEIPVCKACGVEMTRMISHSASNPDRAFYKCDGKNYTDCEKAFKWEDEIGKPESNGKQWPKKGPKKEYEARKREVDDRTSHQLYHQNKAEIAQLKVDIEQAKSQIAELHYQLRRVWEYVSQSRPKPNPNAETDKLPTGQV